MTCSVATVVLAALVATTHCRTFNDNGSTDQLGEVPDEELSPRVICGRDALVQEFPWMISLHYQGRFICNSFLVTPKVIMTAAHCVIFPGEREPEGPKSYKGYIGTVNRDGPEHEMRFTEIIAHSDYGSGTGYDIALMRLESRVTLDAAAQTICLPTKGSLYEDMTAQVMGWGAGGWQSYKTLQTTFERILSNSEGVILTRKHVCAGHRGICFGNSGGPLVALNETKPVAIGISSSSSYFGCASPLETAVYTATASYTDWIVEKMGADAADLCFINRTSTFTSI